jgi:hypothetical protein
MSDRDNGIVIVDRDRMQILVPAMILLARKWEKWK